MNTLKDVGMLLPRLSDRIASNDNVQDLSGMCNNSRFKTTELTKYAETKSEVWERAAYLPQLQKIRPHM